MSPQVRDAESFSLGAFARSAGAAQEFEGGDACGPKPRRATVLLECGPRLALLAVSEPRACEYVTRSRARARRRPVECRVCVFVRYGAAGTSCVWRCRPGAACPSSMLLRRYRARSPP